MLYEFILCAYEYLSNREYKEYIEGVSNMVLYKCLVKVYSTFMESVKQELDCCLNSGQEHMEYWVNTEVEIWMAPHK